MSMNPGTVAHQAQNWPVAGSMEETRKSCSRNSEVRLRDRVKGGLGFERGLGESRRACALQM
jgi:hypothetical protein